MTSISELNCPVCNSSKLTETQGTDLVSLQTKIICIDCSHTFEKQSGIPSTECNGDNIGNEQ